MANKTKLFLLFLLLIPCWVIASHYNVDLVNLYAAAKYTQTDLTRIYAQNGNLGRYFYGPFSLILIKPLALLPFEVVKWLWIVLQTVCYVVFWTFLTRLYPFLKDNKLFWGWFLIWILSINPIHNNYQSNNIQLMLAALLVVGEVWTRKASPRAQFFGGVLATVAAAIKVFPLFIVIYYFLAKPSAVRKGVLVGSALVLVAPLFFFGNRDGMFLYADFFSNLTTYNVENNFSKVPDILCLPSMLSRMNFAAGEVKGIIGVLSAIFFAVVLKNRKRLEDNPQLELHYWAMAWTLCVFLNPSTRPHYFIFYLPAFCSLLQIIYASARASELKLGVLISTLLIAFTAEGVVGKRLNDNLEFSSFPTYGMVLLCLILAWAIHKSQRELVAERVKS